MESDGETCTMPVDVPSTEATSNESENELQDERVSWLSLVEQPKQGMTRILGHYIRRNWLK